MGREPLPPGARVSGWRIYPVAWLIAAVVFVAMDSVWLTLAGERLYRAELAPLLAPAPRIGPAVLFYLIYIAGLTGFCVVPALKAGGPLAAFARGAAFGVVAYATYDLTNQATLAVWADRVTLLDLAWGATVTGVSSLAATAALRPLVRRNP